VSNRILAFNHLSFAYRAKQSVLSDLSLDFFKGTTIAILGPNGAGKTTLLHLALGWLQPTSGHIALEEQPLKSYPRRELGKRIGLVPQSEHIPFEYTVLEYVLLGRSPHLMPLEMPGELDYTIALRSLDQTGLNGFQNRSMLALSGGERQLVLIARSLAQEPDILLLDEPTTHLDLANTQRVLAVLKELQRHGKTIIFTTHSPNAAASVAEYTILMRNGHVLSAGPTKDVIIPDLLSATYGVAVEVAEVNGRTWVMVD